jgi:lipopolysaccharide export system protein LptA
VIWFVALFTVLSVSLHAAPRFEEFKKNHPAFKTEVRTIDAKDFTKVSFSNDMRVEIKQGAEFKVEVSAVQRDQDRVSAKVENGTLRMQKNFEGFGICIFCFHDRPQVTVMMPKIETIEGSNAVSISAEAITADQLSVAVDNGSRAEIKTTATAVKLEASNGSRITVSGTAKDATFNAENGSRISGNDLITQNAIAEASNGSRIQVHATDSLRVNSSNGSRVSYVGDPKKIEGDATLEQQGQPELYYEQ